MQKLGLLFLLALSCAGLTARAQAPNKKVLYLTYSAGYRHDVIPLSMQLLPEIGKKNGFDVVATKDLAFLYPEELKKYDGVVFYTTGELPIGDAEKANLLAWIKSGKGFIGIHCATDTFYKWADYGDMIGGYFNEHPWHQEVKIKVEDPNTPATKGLPNPWVLNDEIYIGVTFGIAVTGSNSDTAKRQRIAHPRGVVRRERSELRALPGPVEM